MFLPLSSPSMGSACTVSQLPWKTLPMSRCTSSCHVFKFSILPRKLPIFRDMRQNPRTLHASTMTRSARRGEKKQALPATPWKEMRSGTGEQILIRQLEISGAKPKVARAPNDDKSCNLETMATQWLELGNMFMFFKQQVSHVCLYIIIRCMQMECQKIKLRIRND